ncbi:PSME3-interacting protein isoform X3 [Carcharodon carcharias]|uniref:PSME3-interacting protein isoform X3 n=1 Tax=Carcharodon carcharias TaxID=13397 RepID=UPI001B7F64DB|nr:PSME3-interacting protein isoform X3 [Carcharodon carcharias]
MDSGIEDSLIKRRFVTEAELDERRKQRQEEWEKVRKPEDPEENMVRGLDEDETNYLDEVSKQQVLLEKQRRDEDAKELKEYRSARTKLAANTESKKEAEKKVVAKPAENKSKFSQAKLLAGAVKRKSSASSEVVKKQKVDNIDGSGHDDGDSCDQAQSDFLTGTAIQHPSASVCVGILPGLGAYSGSSDSDAESSSDSDIIISTGGRIISSVFRSHPFPESP